MASNSMCYSTKSEGLRMLLKANVSDSVIIRSFRILTRAQKKRLFVVTTLQALMSFLDLIGVAIVGLLGALTISGVSTGTPGNRVTQVLDFMQLEKAAFQTQVAILGSLAAAILLGRTILSITFSKKILQYLSHQSASISANLISKILAQPITSLREKSAQEIVYISTTGVTSISLNIIGSSLNLITELALLLVLTLGLVILNPITALSVVLVFLAIAFVLHKVSTNKAKNLGALDTKFSVNSNEEIVEIIDSYREAIVRNRREYYAREIGSLRIRMADVLSEIAFLPSLNKYITEVAVILGALFISAIQFVMQDATHAFGTLAVFLAAGTRIAPAVLRIQQSQLTIRVNTAAAERALTLIDELSETKPLDRTTDELCTIHDGFVASIKLEGIGFKYSANTEAALNNVNIDIDAGEMVAITGPSGAGKTTLTDVLLGVLEPNSGEVKISGMTPLDAIRRWPGAIAYVPQDSKIISGSIKKNVCMGYPENEVADELVWDALRISQLDDFVANLPNGIYTELSENGSSMSGGQRQRLGIARALITKPKLIVLDEATSALDSETEQRVAQAIKNLRGTATIVMIAHRLSSVRDSDKVCYLENGTVTYVGGFEAVKAQVPAFETQAKLMGL